MGLNSKEEKLKELLGLEEEFDIEISDVWSDINQRLDDRDNDNDRKRFFFWLSGFFGLFLIAGALFYFTQSSSSTTQSSLSETTIDQSKSLTENQITKQITETPSQTPQLNHQDVVSSQIEKSSPIITEQSTAQSFNNATASTSNAYNSGTVVSARFSERSSASNGLNNGRDAKSTNIIAPPSIGSSNNASQSNSVLPSLTEEAESILVEETEVNQPMAAAQLLDPMNFLPGLWNQNPEREIVLDESSFGEDMIMVETQSNFSSRWMIGFYAGALTSNNTHSINNAPEWDQAYLFSETGKPGLAGEFFVSKQFKNTFRLSASLQYSNLVSQFRNNYSSVGFVTTDVISATREEEDGSITPLYESLTEEEVTYYDLDWYRQHDLLDVYVGLSKPLLPRRSKFQIVPELGVSYNVLSNHRGYQFTSAPHVVEKLVDAQENLYGDNSGARAHLSMSLEYQFGPCNLMLKANHRTSLNNLMNAASFYGVKQSQFGVLAGVSYILN